MEINIGQVLTANKHMITCIFSNLLYMYMSIKILRASWKISYYNNYMIEFLYVCSVWLWQFPVILTYFLTCVNNEILRVFSHYFLSMCYKFANFVDIVRDLFHVYLNKFEFHFSRLHVNKINNFCFVLNNRRVPCMNK